MITRIMSFLLACLVSHDVQAASAAAARLQERIATIAARAGGRVGVSVIHAESGAAVAVNGAQPLPLYSVFKLPVAVMVLRDVDAGRLRLDQKVTIAKEDVSPGVIGNTARWRQAPVERTIRQLLVLAMVDSDNTASDKLLGLVGGPAAVTRRLRDLGFDGIDIVATSSEVRRRVDNPNKGSAAALTRLLATLQQGGVLKPGAAALLWDVMARSRIGTNRLRGGPPAGTTVMNKSGTGAATTNDVGIIRLPGRRGHLVMAVLIDGSKLATRDQERIIAAIGRAAYDTFSR